MLAIERRNSILEKLKKEKRVVVSELSQLYQVTEETIRRDLEKMENDGLVVKSYGGAVLNEQNIVGLPFDIRKNQCVAEKQTIAGLIAGMVEDGEAVMLDVSSTAVYTAKALKKKEKLTVITNSVEIIVELYDMPEWTVISTGGTLVSTGGPVRATFALGGPHTDEVLSSYHVDKAIVSCKGLDLVNGITDYVEQDASSKRMMLRAARERILAVDHTKFDTTAFTKVTDWSSFTKIVTDRKPEQKWLKEFKRWRIECIYPDNA
ncbi:MAG: DeoR/GlpR family DNA-binding transcription regulator [Lachnospiraceae bacterium]